MFSIRKILIALLFLSPVLVFTIFKPNTPTHKAEISDKSGASISIEIPSDWEWSNSIGKDIGVELIAYPKGTNTDTITKNEQSEKVYLNLVDNSSGVDEEKFVSNDVDEFRKMHSDLQVIEGSPLGKHKAIIRTFESKEANVYETVAYIKLEKGFAVIAHTAPDSITLSKHRHILTTAVKSFKFTSGK